MQEQQPEEEPSEEPSVIRPYEHKPPIALDLKGSKAKGSIHRGGKRQWVRLLELAVAIITLTVITVLMIMPLFQPVATVTIIPSVTTITTTSTLQVQGRTLSTLTLKMRCSSDATSVNAMGVAMPGKDGFHANNSSYNRQASRERKRSHHDSTEPSLSTPSAARATPC
jgi:hypothetical protein